MENEIRNCRNCGSELPEEALFCPECGLSPDTPEIPSHDSPDTEKQTPKPLIIIKSIVLYFVYFLVGLLIILIVITEFRGTNCAVCNKKMGIIEKAIYRTKTNVLLCRDCHQKSRRPEEKPARAEIGYALDGSCDLCLEEIPGSGFPLKKTSPQPELCKYCKKLLKKAPVISGLVQTKEGKALLEKYEKKFAK